MNRTAELQSQVANLEQQNARIMNELDEAKKVIKRHEDAVFKYYPLWMASEKHNEELQTKLDAAVDALRKIDPCTMCEHEFDPEDLACPCYHKRTRDEALKEQ